MPINNRILIDYAMQFVGKPYLYNHQGPSGFDCSGFVGELLRASGVIRGDKTAQAIYDENKDKWLNVNSCGPGTILFYGQSIKEITHCAFGLDNIFCLESSGGDETTTSIVEAEARAAFVRMRVYTRRKDLVAILLPQY